MFDRRAVLSGALVTALLAPAFNQQASAQSTAQYAKETDSLAQAWRVAVAARPRSNSTNLAEFDAAIRFAVGPFRVRADSASATLAQTVITTLTPIVERAYGAFATRLSARTFILRQANDGRQTVALSAVTDSSGRTFLRSSDYWTVNDVSRAWEEKIAELLTDDLGPTARSWVGGAIPIEPQSEKARREARVGLVLATAAAAKDCVAGDVHRCAQSLGVTPVTDPAFEFLNSSQRRLLVQSNARMLRRTDAERFNHCVRDGDQAACDSLAHLVPPEAVGLPVPGEVRVSLARFALDRGGDGAFDRFAAGSTPRERLEAASGMSADSLVSAWRARVMDTRSASTAIDVGTATSSVVWAAVCFCLALRSSRWR